MADVSIRGINRLRGIKSENKRKILGQLFPYLLERVDTLAFGVESVLFVKVSDRFRNGAGISCASRLR
jgi:hypothetical protein